MTRDCCIPNCENNSSTGPLCRVPAKKYCSGQKYEWADELEKCIRGLRQDEWLDKLYKRDNLWICTDHFLASDLIQKGSHLELKIGAIPKLQLPMKSIPKLNPTERPPPISRDVEEKFYHRNIGDVIKSAKRYLPREWEFENTEENILLYMKTNKLGTFPRLTLRVDTNDSLGLHVSAGYCGWFTDTAVALNSIDIARMTISNMLNALTNFSVCQGISQKDCRDFRESDSVTVHHQIAYFYTSETPVSAQQPKLEVIAFRSKQCEIFLGTGIKCKYCAAVERKLKISQSSKDSYRRNVESVPLSRKSSKCLSDRLYATVISQEQKVKELQLRVEELLKDKESQVPVDIDLCSDFSTLLSDGLKQNQVSPFYKIFWDEQIRLYNQSKYGRRFHPEMIRFCLGLAMKSSSAYEQLRDSGILVLPSMRTLFEYRSYHSSSPGFHESTLQELKGKSKSMKYHERLLVLSMDEIKVKENIVYSRSKDKMVGYVDLGESRNTSSNCSAPATHALQVYARGLVTTFSKPVAYYATKTTSSFQLSSIFWECVENLEDCGFQVVALIADGLSANRKMFEELNNLHLEFPYKCKNIHHPERSIFLIFDAPHLLKTVRNNVYASQASGTRLLKKDGKYIKWEHFTAVPKLFKSSELRCCKLSDSHFRMQSFAKMRVVYAAQLLSGSVARLMRARGGDEMEASAWFSTVFNKWFDLMNTSTNFGKNPDLKPYRSVEDARINWLLCEFLPQLRQWKRSCTGATAGEKAKQFLSWQTYQGLEITTMAIVELIQMYLPLLPAGGFIITRRINQDPLEAFFGQIRRSGGTCENPDIEHYGQFQRIIDVGKDLKWRRGSNVMNDPSDPMPKRSKN